MTDPTPAPLPEDSKQLGMVGQRTLRAGLTWVANGLHTVLAVGLAFFTVPLILHYLGTERFGAHRAATEWLSFLSMSDLGLSSGVSILIIQAQRGIGQHSVAQVVRLGIKVLGLLSLFTLLVGLPLAWCLPWLVPVSPPLVDELRWAALLSLLGFALLPLAVFRFVLDASQRGYLINAGLMLNSLATLGLSVYWAFLGWGLPGQMVAMLVGNSLFSLFILVAALRLLPDLRTVTTANIGWPRLLEVSWPILLALIGTRLNLMTDAIMVGFLISPATVASFVLTQRLVMLVGTQINSLTHASWAGLLELRAAGRQQDFADRVLEVSRLQMGLATLGVGTVAAYNERFVTLWVGADAYAGDAVTLFTAASSVIFCFLCLFCSLIDSQGDTRYRIKISLWGSALNFGLTALLIPLIGPAGAVLATCLAYLATDAWYAPYLAALHYQLSFSLIMQQTVRSLAISLPWVAGLWIWTRWHGFSGGWWELILEMAVAGCLTLLYAWLLVFPSADRLLWKQRLRRLILRQR